MRRETGLAQRPQETVDYLRVRVRRPQHLGAHPDHIPCVRDAADERLLFHHVSVLHQPTGPTDRDSNVGASPRGRIFQ